jgi:integrase
MSLHVWCFKCKKVVTASPCKHESQQRFQSRVYNPFTKTVNCINAYETRDVEEAFTLHRAYVVELKANDYNVKFEVPETADHTPGIVFIKDATQRYFSWMRDVGLPRHKKKDLSENYIREQQSYVTRFLKIIKEHEGKIGDLPAISISDKHVGYLDKALGEEDKTSNATYNAYMKAARYFVNYLIEEEGLDMKNPFQDVSLLTVHQNPESITEEELQHFLTLITPENGISSKGIKKVSAVQYYKPWLKKAILLGLLTGERLDGLVKLRWSYREGSLFKIPNGKVNQLRKEQTNYSYTPVTEDLEELLTQFEMTDPDGYIIEPTVANRYTLKKFISKAFTHYWRQTGSKKEVSFKHLRKTYVTMLTKAIGQRALFVKHNEDKTAVKHYLDKKELLDKVTGVRLYNGSL